MTHYKGTIQYLNDNGTCANWALDYVGMSCPAYTNFKPGRQLSKNPRHLTFGMCLICLPHRQSHVPPHLTLCSRQAPHRCRTSTRPNGHQKMIHYYQRLNLVDSASTTPLLGLPKSRVNEWRLQRATTHTGKAPMPRTSPYRHIALNTSQAHSSKTIAPRAYLEGPVRHR